MAKERKNPYIAHLAEFRFEPEFNWSRVQAENMYNCSNQKGYDKIHWSDCIAGMQKLPEQSVDLIIADPPFGIKFTGKEAFYNRNEDLVAEDYTEINGDYGDFTKRWISELPRIMKKSASAYIFSGYTNLKDVLSAIDEAGLFLKNHLIWHYTFGVFTKTKFVTSHYHVLYVVKDPKHSFFHRIQHYVEDVWDMKRAYSPGEIKNGTKLPEDVVQRCIDYSSMPGELILDPFLGNGTTAVVAKKNFRHFVGFEMNRKMKPIIERNLQKSPTGVEYIPYKERLESPEQLAQKEGYARAYELYLKETATKSKVCPRQ